VRLDPPVTSDQLIASRWWDLNRSQTVGLALLGRCDWQGSNPRSAHSLLTSVRKQKSQGWDLNHAETTRFAARHVYVKSLHVTCSPLVGL